MKKKNWLLEMGFIILYLEIDAILIYFVVSPMIKKGDFPTFYFYFPFGFVIFFYYMIPKILQQQGFLVKALRLITTGLFLIIAIFRVLNSLVSVF